MRKFKCNNCVNRECTAYYNIFNSVNRPSRCTAGSEYSANWHEVKEDSAETAQTTVEPKQLPDWVKVGAVGYDDMNNEYFEVIEVNNDSFRAKSIDSSNSCSSLYFNEFVYEANKRPFNEKEMRELVGKVIETSHVALLVDAYMKVTKNIVTSCGIYTAEELRDRFTVDGKPCYKLEHLNEKGEWVE